MQNPVRFWTPSRLIVFVAFGFTACVSCYPAIAWAGWLNCYNGPANSSDWPHAVAVDPDGNVYVTGSSGGGCSTDSDYATIKYDPNGD